MLGPSARLLPERPGRGGRLFGWPFAEAGWPAVAVAEGEVASAGVERALGVLEDAVVAHADVERAGGVGLDAVAAVEPARPCSVNESGRCAGSSRVRSLRPVMSRSRRPRRVPRPWRGRCSVPRISPGPAGGRAGAGRAGPWAWSVPAAHASQTMSSVAAIRLVGTSREACRSEPGLRHTPSTRTEGRRGRFHVARRVRGLIRRARFVAARGAGR